MAVSAAAQSLCRWRDLLDGDDPHAITQQLDAAFFRHVAFTVLDWTASRAAFRGAHCALRNPFVQELVVRAYPAQAALAVRRLTDRRDSKPQRGVISLVSILEEIRDQGAAVTREAYVTQGGLPYDPEPAAREHAEKVNALLAERWASRKRDTVIADQIPSAAELGLPDFKTARLRHDRFDLLSAVGPADRQPADVPSPAAMAILLRTCGYDHKTYIGPVRQLRNAADKAVAHAADGWSRRMPSEAPLTVVHRAVIEVHARLFAVYRFLFRFLRDGDIGVPPGMPLNPLAHVELGGFTESDRRRLRLIASGVEARYDRLAKAALADLEAELARLQGC